MSQQSFQARLDGLLSRGDQVRVARAIDVSPQTISDWKHGRRRPRPEHVAALERVLDLDAGQLSRHLGYVPVAAEEQGRYEADLLRQSVERDIEQALTDLPLPLDRFVDDIDTFTREAATAGLRLALGRLAVELFEREHGELTADELADAATALDGAAGRGGERVA